MHIWKNFILGFLILASPAMPAEEPVYPVIVLGGGMGALSSAVYLGRAEMRPLVIEGRTPGGLLTQSHSVQNWPGEMEIEGHLLTDKIRQQAEQNGAQFFQEEVVAVDFSKRPFKITTRTLDGRNRLRTRQAESCIIATGTEPNLLGVPGEQEYWGRGVTNCAICDGNLYRDQIVGVVGGGDAAVLEALYLSNIAKEVYVFVRKDKLKATEEKRIQTLLAKKNVKLFYNTEVTEIQGSEKKLSQVMIKTRDQTSPFRLDGLFLAIGSRPNSALFKNILDLDARGYILLRSGQQTSIAGVYAVGDIVDPIYKQAVSAAGDGAKAALQAQQYISDRANHLIAKTKPADTKSQIAKQTTVIDIQSLEQFEQELKSSKGPVVVDFYATWCGPCKRIAPILANSAEHLAGKVKILKVNVDKMHHLSKTYNIRSMPTALLFDAEGKVVERKVGPDQITELLQSLEKKAF